MRQPGSPTRSSSITPCSRRRPSRATPDSRGVRFEGDALNPSIFEGDAEFTGATFEGQVSLSPLFHGKASFDWAVLVQLRQLGPLLARRQVSLSDVVFEKWVQLEKAPVTFACHPVRAGTVALVSRRDCSGNWDGLPAACRPTPVDGIAGRAGPA
jgi:hypothetical protein